MAKITTSALIDNISGSMSGTTFKRNKGGLLMMNKMRPRNPRSSSQQLTRMNASYLSGKWNSLPNTSKDLWNQFASLSKPSWSGINAFVALNLNLITSNYGGFSIVTNPPPTPSTPRFVESLYVSKTSGSYNTIYWNHPQTSSDYISIYYSIPVSYTHLTLPTN